MPSSDALSRRTRLALVGFGACSWLAGGVGAFIADNDIASTALVVGGVAALLVAAIGRWPEKIAIGGNEATWRRELAETVQQEIDAAPQAAVPALRSIQRQIEQPLPSEAGPGVYDRRLQAAIQRELPDISIRDSRRSGGPADFELALGAAVLLLETKYVKPPATMFRGRTLDSLLEQVPEGRKLLVVANVANVDVARAKVRGALGVDRCDVITWRSDADNPALVAAVRRLTGAAGANP
jgi:hypothetical protein